METGQRQGDQHPQMQWKNPGIQSSLSRGWAVYSEAHSARPRLTKTLGCGQHNGGFEGRMVDTPTPYTSEGDTGLQRL